MTKSNSLRIFIYSQLLETKITTFIQVLGIKCPEHFGVTIY